MSNHIELPIPGKGKSLLSAVRRHPARFALALSVVALGVGGLAGPAFADPTAPAQPAAPTLTTSLGTITATIVAPDDGGSPITDYTVDCTSSDGGAEGTATEDDLSIVVSGLTTEATYTCTVTATNEVGDSDASPASDPIEVLNVPAAPAQPTGTAGDNADISVAFVAPDDGGSPITSYSADCTSSDGGVGGVETGASSPIDVTGLTLGDDYTCTVTATNGQGTSDASEASESVTVPAVAPDVPVITSVDLGSNSVTLAFTDAFDGGSSITGFTATCASSNGGTTESNSEATSPITVSSLSNGYTYTCTVLATNEVGSSAASVASASFQAISPPAAPTLGTVTFGTNSATVAFTGNGTGGDAIQAYIVTCTSSNGGITRSQLGLTSPITVGSLSNGDSYTCAVVAMNTVGDGPASSATSSFSAATVPGAPTISNATNATTSATVTFTDATSGGSAITSFTVTCTSSNGGTTESNSGATSPITVTGLTAGKAYTCKVTATNDVGTGAASAASTSFTASTVPAAPSKGTVTLGANSASVAFTAGSNEGSPITSFTVTCTSSNGGTTESNTGTSSPIVVSSLTNGDTYTCTIVATNADGSSAASVATASFVAATVPAAPTIGAATRGPNSASVAFTANANGGSTITGFTVTCTSSNGGTTRTGTGTSSPIVVSSLTNGDTYTCTAVASNPVGSSAASSATSSFVAATVPGAPSITLVTHSVATSVTVTFTDSVTGGSAITSYTLTCTSSNGGTTESTSGATSPLTVSGLPAGKIYTCRVTATNAIGTGSASAPTASFTA